MRALIGHTGFVGGNLDRQTHFTHRFNTSNIESLAGETFDLVVCAGAPAEKWKANADPEADRASLARLSEALFRCNAQRVILISTIDVYPSPRGVDEDTAIDAGQAAPYGRHRVELERAIADRFDTLVVRLPGLFGPGLKKNAIYDLMHDNQVDKLHADNTYQFYDLTRLWADIATAERNDIRLINLSTEPVSIEEVAREGFGIAFDNRPGPSTAAYDVRTRHHSLFGQGDGYVESKTAVLDAIRRFVQLERAR